VGLLDGLAFDGFELELGIRDRLLRGSVEDLPGHARFGAGERLGGGHEKQGQAEREMSTHEVVSPVFVGHRT
jgi:hypothetical protein